jgi:hypothetical protein
MCSLAERTNGRRTSTDQHLRSERFPAPSSADLRPQKQMSQLRDAACKTRHRKSQLERRSNAQTKLTLRLSPDPPLPVLCLARVSLSECSPPIHDSTAPFYFLRAFSPCPLCRLPCNCVTPTLFICNILVCWDSLSRSVVPISSSNTRPSLEPRQLPAQPHQIINIVCVGVH